MYESRIISIQKNNTTEKEDEEQRNNMKFRDSSCIHLSIF